MSLETRIALIGVVGALAGTLVGGAVTYAVTQDQISSQKAESRRSERVDAYSKFFGDSTRLWTEVFAMTLSEPKRLNAAQASELNTTEEALIGEFALVALLAPPSVRNVGQQLSNVNTDVWNALLTRRIDYAGYSRAARQALGKRGLIHRFADAMRADLGTH